MVTARNLLATEPSYTRRKHLLIGERNRSLGAGIVGHGLARIAGAASGVLIGVYFAALSGRGTHVGAGFVGVLGAVSFAAELVASVPLGTLSDAVSPRRLMVTGALLAGFATWLMGVTLRVPAFVMSRVLEGVGAAAMTPPLLAWLAEVTERDAGLRARVMSFFELSLLGGLGLGGIVATELWQWVGARGFDVIAGGYSVCAVLFYTAVRGGKAHGRQAALSGLRKALQDRAVRHLAPVWLCINAVAGLWLGPTLAFLLTRRATSGQYLDGIFAADPTRVGWLLLAYSVVFGVGVTAWSFVLPRLRVRTAMKIALAAMLPVCGGLYVLNHSAAMTDGERWMVGVATALLVMVESGFTPAALAWLAQSLGRGAGKGAAMSVYIGAVKSGRDCRLVAGGRAGAGAAHGRVAAGDGGVGSRSAGADAVGARSGRGAGEWSSMTLRL